MVGPLSSRCSWASQAEGALTLQPGILGIDVPLRQRTAGVTETLIPMNTWTVLLEDVMGVFHSSRMRRLTVRDTKTRGQCLFYGYKNESLNPLWVNTVPTLRCKRQSSSSVWQYSSCLRQVVCETLYILSQCCLLQLQLKALNWTHKPEGPDSQCGWQSSILLTLYKQIVPGTKQSQELNVHFCLCFHRLWRIGRQVRTMTVKINKCPDAAADTNVEREPLSPVD